MNFWWDWMTVRQKWVKSTEYQLTLLTAAVAMILININNHGGKNDKISSNVIKIIIVSIVDWVNLY